MWNSLENPRKMAFFRFHIRKGFSLRTYEKSGVTTGFPRNYTTFKLAEKEGFEKTPTPINAINTLFLIFVSSDVSTFSLVTATNNFIEIIVDFRVNILSFI